MNTLIARSAAEAKAREIRTEVEHRMGGRFAPADRRAVDSVLGEIVLEALIVEGNRDARKR